MRKSRKRKRTLGKPKMVDVSENAKAVIAKCGNFHKMLEYHVNGKCVWKYRQKS